MEEIQDSKIKLVILSGLAGAGKTTAARIFEGLGYYVVEDLPTRMLKDLFAFFKDESERFQRVALLIPLKEIPEAARLAHEDKRFDLTVIGLDCLPDVLLTRFKLTRHIHPLMIKGHSLSEAMVIDRKAFEAAEVFFDVRIDTSSLNEAGLRDRITSVVKEDDKGHLSLFISSFGYKYGMPLDGDTIIDARVLKNPYWVPELAGLCGLDKEVIDYIEADPKTEPFVQSAIEYLKTFLPLCEKDGRQYVYVGVGCSGGQHRSVYVAERIYQAFKDQYRASVNHRESDSFRPKK